MRLAPSNSQTVPFKTGTFVDVTKPFGTTITA